MIQNRINGVLQDLADFHISTFNIEDCNTADYIETGYAIDKYLQGYEMTREEDACYLSGKLDAYRDCLTLFENTKLRERYSDYLKAYIGNIESMDLDPQDVKSFEEWLESEI